MATRRSAEEIQQLLEEYRQSGEGRTEFCRRQGIPVTTLDYSGLTGTSLSGTGWTCIQPAGPCSRNDLLAFPNSYPALTLFVNVAANAAVSVSTVASVSGGGETNTSNDTATDVATVIAPNLTTGIRSTGSYWGAAGGQINLQTGNLNYTLGVMQPQSRGGGASFTLSYNSQIWKQIGSTSTNVAIDVGYGLGWTLCAGSISQGASNYIFRDGSGAEYILDQAVSGVWTSSQGTYVSFNQFNSTLYFNDGSSWVMGAKSAPAEPDGGTMYPTLMEDTNGNYLS